MALPSRFWMFLRFSFFVPAFADSTRESLEALFATDYAHHEEVNRDWVLNRERHLFAWQKTKAVMNWV
ncbi:hypothetical protein MO867_15070 [Microbulbifer sp. OS29]|uniref:Uncharacterized protein n=1 Tax=Microbulbifer okhotskensis TaxID=2926617 RepID=A0A9X2ENV7_9GAMM|nr:hypothetical protein [Microbulbifer okhotskensis]MCO1335657.1 hypothetical protein [Microbulbifer okhotskensis]